MPLAQCVNDNEKNITIYICAYLEKARDRDSNKTNNI